jgi:[glutamine synthetase] adenylyltransferase / [glutamine synthetase]-adenylyl-L-tyrosine phosphorylase
MQPDQVGRRLAALEAGSRTLAKLLEQDEQAGALLSGDGPLPAPETYLEMARVAASKSEALAELRLFKRRRLAEIAARDLAGEAPIEEVCRALADLAASVLQAALEWMGAAEDVAVIGMGKLGGRELNYASDIDLMFASGEDVSAGRQAAEKLLELLGGFSEQGQAYRIDLNLRPEGRSGVLVRSVDAYLEYYRRWAQPWEHQALIKARSVAGAQSIGESLVAETRAIVFPTEVPPERIASIRKMKERVEEHAQRSARRSKENESTDVKLGPGGIRDIEFSVQLLQLVHGGTDPSVRSASTVDALSALVQEGYVAEDDGAGLSVAYRWLRNIEHRLQLWQERQVHVLPRDEESLTRIARSMGFQDSPAASARERFESAHRAVLADVRGRFEKLFYRPMIEALAETPGARLSEGALRERLRVLGFRDVDRAARTLSGLVAGTSRRSKLFRVLTPALLRFLATTPMPDEGLFAFLRLGESLEDRMDLLGALRDNPPGLEFLARVLGSGRLLGEVLTHVPEEVATIADPQGPEGFKDRGRLLREARASLGWREPERRLDGLRRFKRRELLRIALVDLAGTEDVGPALGDLADACISAALEDPGFPFAVIGMGKLGGRELGYPSDIDVMFVHEGDQMEAEELAETLLKAIGEVTPEGQAFRIDAGLRPEGKSGPLARSLDSFLEYYRRWSSPWEHLALIKARPVAGDLELAARLVRATRDLAFPMRMDQAALSEIRHLKARMERERIPRGTEPRRHIKLGPGCMSDVEFAVQLLQMRNGVNDEGLRTTNTKEAIRVAKELEHLSEDESDQLLAGYSFLERLRNHLFFMAARPVDVLPVKPEELEALGIAVGFDAQPRQELEEAYLRTTRRIRKIAEPLIYGS